MRCRDNISRAVVRRGSDDSEAGYGGERESRRFGRPGLVNLRHPHPLGLSLRRGAVAGDVAGSTITAAPYARVVRRGAVR